MKTSPQPKNIIVRMPNWLGDFVMATPILTILRSHFPSSSITAMCKEPLASLLQEDQDVDAVFSFQKPEGNLFQRTMGTDIVEGLKAGKYDCGILLTNSFSSAWWFFLGNIPRRIGFANSIRRFLLTDPVKPVLSHEHLHLVDAYKRILSPLGIHHSTASPRLFLSSKVKQEMQDLLKQRNIPEKKKLILIHPGAAFGTAKCWLPERFTALAEKLLLDPDTYIIFVGSLQQEELIKNICRSLSKRAINLAGATNLMELACLIAQSDLLITNDSGPMHIAAALHIPLVALFGSTNPEITGPYLCQESVIWKEVPCSPCFRRICTTDFSCMKSITVEEVYQKILQVWKHHGK